MKFNKQVIIGKNKKIKNYKYINVSIPNQIVINENKGLALDETYSFLELCSGYYPIVLLYSDIGLSSKSSVTWSSSLIP